MNPTAEQAQAVELFRSGGSLVIEAGAGTGKTSTLVLIAEDAGRRRGQYVAFNKALVTDSAGKFHSGVASNTAHSLAFRAVGRHFAHRLNGDRMPAWQLAKALGIEPIHTTAFDGSPKTLTPTFLANHLKRAISQFCRTVDTEIGTPHFEYIDGLDQPSPEGMRTYVKNLEVRRALLPAARELWADLREPTGRLPFTHDIYLKLWQLGDPLIDASYILFDEAQDANPVIADIVARQAIRGVQLVYVGDSQQEIYGWTGAVNALGTVRADNRTFLTQSFRFGQAVADRANEVLEDLDAVLRLTGNPAIDSTVGTVERPRAILTRTNATGIRTLMTLQSAGIRPHYLGGSSDVLGFARAAEELMTTGRTSHHDLACFDGWQAVQQYVKEDADGQDLALMVRLVDDFGTEAIVGALGQMPPETTADLVITTAHKAKGRQWESVQLAPDFAPKPDKEGNLSIPSDAEQRLLYVALTRAQLRLDMDAVDFALASARDD